jgi:predicted unusual protein kinase regulating ubiquinone biosynthesis (AarF/ABC1/UbiB family)
MSADDDQGPDTGRFKRLTRLAGLGARLSTGVMARGVKRIGGGQEALIGKEEAQALVVTLGEMKGLAMKVGQMVSMNPELLSPEIRAVVSKLQNQAPPMPWATVKRVVEEELHGPPEKLYRSFDEVALASASLGQVHRAVTHDGLEVAVKVQYPEIRQALKADLSNMNVLVKVLSTSTGLSEGKGYFDEVRHHLENELDYRKEAALAKAYARAAAPLPDVVVPKVVDALTSERVLTLELLHGQHLRDFLHTEPFPPNEARFAAARLLIRAIWGPFLTTGLMHADPHPGNFLLLPGGKLGVLDYGSTVQLSPAMREVNHRLFHAVALGEPYDPVALSRECGFRIEGKDEVVRPFIHTVIHHATQHVRSRDFDFHGITPLADVKWHFARNARAMYQVMPPREAMMFFRAQGGLMMNLQSLAARGDYAQVHLELAALKPLG